MTVLVITNDSNFFLQLQSANKKDNYIIIPHISFEALEKSLKKFFIKNDFLLCLFDIDDFDINSNSSFFKNFTLNKKPFIFFSSYISKELIQKALEIGAENVLSKNLSYFDLTNNFFNFCQKCITNRKKSDEKIKELIHNEELFKAIASTANDAIILTDKYGKILFWNDSATKIFKYSLEEALGSYIHDLIAPQKLLPYYKDGLKKLKEHTLDTNNNTIELQALKKTGEVIPIDLSFSTFEINYVTYNLAIIRDITYRKATEEELEKLVEELHISRDIIEQQVSEQIALNQKILESEEKLQELNKSKDKLFSIIAHDLRNPFQGLMGYAKILAENLKDFTKEEIEEIVHDINESAQNIYKLLENLLHWSRVQRGVIKYNPVNVSVHQLAKINIDIANLTAAQKKITIINDVPLELEAFADVESINTVLRNLLTNAVKFSNIGTKITVSAREFDENYIEISVQDEGVGIPEENLPLLFKVDSQFTTAGTANEKGTGLGLVLCKELVELNKGSISVESKLGVGTTFKFTLPKPNTV